MKLYLNHRCMGNCNFCLLGKEKAQCKFDYTEEEVKYISNFHDYLAQTFETYRECNFFGGDIMLEGKDYIHKIFNLWYNNSRYKYRYCLEWVTSLHLIEKKVDFVLDLFKEDKEGKINCIFALSFDGEPNWDIETARSKKLMDFYEAVHYIHDKLSDYKNRFIVTAKKVITPQEVIYDKFVENEKYTDEITSKLIKDGLLRHKNYNMCFPFYVWNKQTLDKLISQLPHIVKGSKSYFNFIENNAVEFDVTKFNNEVQLVAAHRGLVPSDGIEKFKKDNIVHYFIDMSHLYKFCKGCEYVDICSVGCLPIYMRTNFSVFPYCYFMSEMIRKFNLTPPKNDTLLKKLYYKDPYYVNLANDILSDDVWCEKASPLSNLINATKCYRKGNKKEVLDLLANIEYNQWENKLLQYQLLWWATDDPIWRDKQLDLVGNFYKPF